MKKSENTDIFKEEIIATVNIKPSDVLNCLQSASIKQFLVETTDAGFSVTFRNATNKAASVRLDGVVDELGQGSRIKIQTSGTDWALSPKTIIRRIIITCLLYLFLYQLTHSNWIFIYFILTLLFVILMGEGSKKYQKTVASEQKKLLLQFLKDKFPDMAINSRI